MERDEEGNLLLNPFWFPRAAHYIQQYMGVWSDERVLAIIHRAERIATHKAYWSQVYVRCEDVDAAIREV